MRLFEGWTTVRYVRLFEQLQTALTQHGIIGLLDLSVAALPPELYQPVFAVSLDLMLADGIVRDEEEQFLYKLQQACRIDSDLASQITHVILMKNQC